MMTGSGCTQQGFMAGGTGISAIGILLAVVVSTRVAGSTAQEQSGPGMVDKVA